MTDVHERAADLLMLAGVEGISDKEQLWLQQHLSGCAQCAQFAESVQFAASVVRSQPLSSPSTLVARTKVLVHVRADERRERNAWLVPIWISCGLALVISFVTTPYLWQFCAWIGGVAALPKLMWQSIFAMAWFFPAALTAALILALRPAAWEQTPHGEVMNG
jgi:hypothetical protein